MEAANVVVGKVVDVLFVQIRNHLSYLFCYKDNVTKFSDKVEDLKIVRERMLGRIDEAERKGEIVEADVQTWISSVDVITSEAEAFLASEGDAAKKKKIACFNLRSRYSSSKKASKKTSLVIDIYDKADKFNTISHPAPLPGISAHSRKNIDAYKSQMSAMKHIMEALSDKEIRIVGVCGIGGVGKTTLVTELGKRVKESKEFDEVVMAVVSQTINIQKLQDEISGMLGMDTLPDNGEQRREKLWDRIKKERKILVILDDLWSRLDLEELGIPAGDHYEPSNCKIILTSRSENICNVMDAQRIIPVSPMPEEEAWSLFKEVVGDDAIDSGHDLNPIARQVFKECGGLPISILAVGKALKNKREQDWHDALYQLKKVAPLHVNPLLKDVYPKLELSYKHLESKDAKLCLLLCSLFPEDHDIGVESLARYGMGLRLFQDCGPSLQDARVRARLAVSVLKTSYLLLDGRDDDYVKMHDVIRDVTIAIGCKDGQDVMFMAKAAARLGEWPEMQPYKNYTGISLMSNDISEVPVGLKCSKLQILLLQNNYSLSTIPDDFFQEMEELKVIELQRCRITALPRSLLLLTNVRTLRLDGTKLQDISLLSELKGLEILGLPSTNVSEIPEELGNLTNLRLLDMRDCNKLQYIVPGVISSLRKLEDLYISHSIDKTEREGNSTKFVSLEELNSLPKLTNLEISIPHTELFPENLNLQFKSLVSSKIILGGKSPMDLRWIRPCKTMNRHSSIFHVTLDMDVRLLGWMKKLIWAAEFLSLNKITDLSFSDINFDKVRFLQISECCGISCLTDVSNLSPKPIFSSLEQVEMRNLQNLTQICHGQLLPGESFRKLRNISIHDCHKMSAALGLNLLLALENLTELEVRNCSSLECILGAGAEIRKEGETKCLQLLTHLNLADLSNLVDIWNIHNDRFVSLCGLKSISITKCLKLRRLFPSMLVKGLVSLEDVYVNDCPSLEYVFEPPMEMEGPVGTYNMNGATCFQNLVKVRVYSCGNLRYVFPLSIAEGLLQLKELRVSDNEKLETVIGGGDDKTREKTESSAGNQKKMVFPRLSLIRLNNLPALKSFVCSQLCFMIQYPSLGRLRVLDCPALETWGYGTQVTPMLEPKKMHVNKTGILLKLREGDYGRELNSEPIHNRSERYTDL